MRAAQKIAYNDHSWEQHGYQFPNMTQDQLADEIHQMFVQSQEDPQSLITGLSKSDGAPVLFDPKTGVAVIRNPGGDGTAFKPSNPTNWPGNKICQFTRLAEGDLIDAAPMPQTPAEPAPAVARAPVEPIPEPMPSGGSGGGGGGGFGPGIGAGGEGEGGEGGDGGEGGGVGGGGIMVPFPGLGLEP